MEGNDFFIEQLKTPSLALYSYYIESDGEAAIIDPLVNSEPYLQILKNRETKLKYILLTHIHADFVSGHVNLAKKTNAKICIGYRAKIQFISKQVKDKDILQLGKVSFRVVSTPGHTMESVCYVLRNKKEEMTHIFTGDTMFLGEVGRPDLSAHPHHKTKFLAEKLYESIQKLKMLPDELLVYPGHGKGSSCGKNIQEGTFSTIKIQKKLNYALKLNKHQFIDSVS